MSLAVLAEVAQQFLILSLLSVGGANAIIPEIHMQAVEKHGWMTDEDFTQMFALSQAAPGPNVLIVSLIGWRAAGLAGAVVALLAVCAPAAVLSWWIADLWERFKDSPWRRAIQRAIAPLVVGLTLSGGYVLCTPATPDWRLWAIAAGAAAAVLARRVNPLWLLAAGGAVGAFLLQ